VSKLSPLTVLALSALVSPAAAQIGAVVRAQKLNEVVGGIVGPIARLGYSLAAIGDLNGDGVGDLVAGVPTDSSVGQSHGALLVLFLNSNGTVRAQQKISETVGGLAANLPDGAAFGIAVTSLGDLDGDGRAELAVRTDNPRKTWILFLDANGTVRAQHEIPWTDPVYGGTTEREDFDSAFVRGLLALGDLDGDGIGDLAVAAPGDDDGYLDAGAVWFLYMNPDGSAKAAKKISETSGGLAGNLAPGSHFGESLARLGDVNGDGFPDLCAAVYGGAQRWVLFLDGNQDVIGTAHMSGSEVLGAIGDLDGDGISECASDGFEERFLAADGHVRKELLVWPGRNGMPLDPSTRELGYASIAALGDLDGDGTLELAVSDLYDVQSGGAIWILSLARSPVRNGSGANPLILTEGAEPVLGGTCNATLDCSGHASSFAALIGYERAGAGRFIPAGELLLDPTSTRFFLLLRHHTGGPVNYSIPVPNDPALVNLQIFEQGACGGAPGLVLSNALGLVIAG